MAGTVMIAAQGREVQRVAQQLGRAYVPVALGHIDGRLPTAVLRLREHPHIASHAPYSTASSTANIT